LTGEQGPLHLLYLINDIFFNKKKYLDIINIFYNKNKNLKDAVSTSNDKIKKN
jgi:hypothetical protein